ncbi:MAG: hypothetical protein V1704_01930 [Candidatus Vogelbacteria bacterium]
MPLLDNSYTIYLENRFNKYLENLPAKVKEVFDEKMEYFRNNPSHPSLNTKPYSVSGKKLKELGVDQVYEFYINRKDYRCIFYVTHEPKEIIIAYVGNHTQVKNRFR